MPVPIDPPGRSEKLGLWLLKHVSSMALILSTIISASISALCTTIIGAFRADITDKIVIALVIIAVLATGCAPLFEVLRSLRERAKQKKIDRYEEDRLTLFRYSIVGALSPLAKQLSEIAGADVDLRSEMAGLVCQRTVGSIARALGTRDQNRNRATFYRLVNDELIYVTHDGRSWDEPRPRFAPDSAEGAHVLNLVKQGDAELIPDVSKHPSVKPRHPGRYNCVIAAAVRIGDRPMGMLTVDAPDVGELTLDDENIMRVLARILAVALHNATSHEQLSA